MYKWVPTNLMLGEILWGTSTHPIHRGVEMFLVLSFYGNQHKLRPDGPSARQERRHFLPISIVNVKENLNVNGSTLLHLIDQCK